MKTCSKCGRPEGEVTFQVEKTRTGGLRSRLDCKECRKIYRLSFLAANPTYFTDYYANNKRLVNDRCVVINLRRRQERYGLIAKLKSNPCVDCKGSFPSCVMDFDHRDRSTKVMDISLMVKRLVPWDRILDEIAKCDLVCVCCHRLRTYHGSNSYKTRRFHHHKAILDTLKSTTPCLDCGGSFKPCQMDFDHTGATLKKANIAQLVGGRSDVLVEELSKCHLVCANCHRVRGSTGERPPNEGTLVSRFREIEAKTSFPEDQRTVNLPWRHLIGTMTDAALARQVGSTRDMVGWFRRKMGLPAFRSVRGKPMGNRSIVEIH